MAASLPGPPPEEAAAAAAEEEGTRTYKLRVGPDDRDPNTESMKLARFPLRAPDFSGGEGAWRLRSKGTEGTMQVPRHKRALSLSLPRT